MKNEFKELLQQCPLIAILRGVTPDEIVAVCKVLVERGIKLIEIPLNSPNAIESIRLAAAHYEDTAVMIGAGTVLTADQVSEVAAAGGRYIISPNYNAKVIGRTKETGLISIPGFLTPSEAFAALESGADFLKCFPAANMGADYLKNLKAVVSAPMLAVGGITLENMNDYLEVSAGTGIGSAIYRSGKSLSDVANDAAAFCAELANR